MPAMNDRQKRQGRAKDHARKFLVVVDETPECENAVAYAAARARSTREPIVFLYVIEPGDFQHWLGVEEIAREEGHAKAKAVFRLFSRKLKAMGFEDIAPEEIVREGVKGEEIMRLIEEDPDIGILVLGASKDPAGPGPLISWLAAGRAYATFPVPITVVPGHLSADDIQALA
jgi:nucleotide-binding universal stress UspA family protein